MWSTQLLWESPNVTFACVGCRCCGKLVNLIMRLPLVCAWVCAILIPRAYVPMEELRFNSFFWSFSPCSLDDDLGWNPSSAGPPTEARKDVSQFFSLWMWSKNSSLTPKKIQSESSWSQWLSSLCIFLALWSIATPHLAWLWMYNEFSTPILDSQFASDCQK